MEDEYLSLVGNETCKHLHLLTSSNQRCDFVKNSTFGCVFVLGFLPYFEFLYCIFKGSLVYLGLVLELIWCLTLLLMLAIVADEFFSPSLVVIAKFLRFSDNLAGVTLLALGNGAGDIFSAFAATKLARAGNAGLLYGSIFGAGILVTTVTVGIIGFVKPFTSQRRPLLKDIIFYIISVVWNVSILAKKYIHFAEAVGFILLYIIYVIFTVISRTVRLRMLKKEKDESGSPNNADESKEIVKLKNPFKRKRHSDEIASLKSNGDVEMVAIKKVEGFDNPVCSIDSLDEQKPTTVQEPIATTPTTPTHISHVEPPRRVRSSTQTRERSDTVTSIRPSYMTRWVISHRSDDDALLQSERPAHRPLARQRSRSHLGHGGMGEPSKEQPEINYRPRRRASTIDIPMQRTAPAIAEEPVATVADDSRKDQQENTQDNGADDRARTLGWGPTDYYHADAKVERQSISQYDETEEEYVVPGFFKHLLVFINPIDVANWKDMSRISRTYEIIRSPLQLLLLFLIPKSNEEHPTRGWCKLLVMIQCLITPIFWLFAFEILTKTAGPMPIWAIVLIIGVILSVVVYFTSSYKEPPAYHWAVSMIGFITSIVIIYTVINEVVNILQTFGVVLGISAEIIALTFLAWANSVADIMSNAILAKNNFPRIAIAACFAGPVFNVQLGLGIPFLILTYSGTKIPYRFDLNVTTVQFLMMVFLLAALILHLILLPLFKFRIDRKYAVFWIIFYAIFVVVALLGEMKVIVINF